LSAESSLLLRGGQTWLLCSSSQPCFSAQPVSWRCESWAESF